SADRFRIVFFGLLVFLAAVSLTFVITSRLAKPIRELTRVAQRIVQEGDLTQQITVSSSDEVGQLAASFAQMVAKLREIPGSLRESVQLLTDSVNNVAASTEAQGQTVSKQAAALQETQVTAQEIK